MTKKKSKSARRAVVVHEKAILIFDLDNPKDPMRYNPARFPSGVLKQGVVDVKLSPDGKTLAVLVALLALGGPVIRDFTIVLILGVVIGTYSSIFVASPALIEIQKKFGMGGTKEKKPRPEAATV